MTAATPLPLVQTPNALAQALRPWRADGLRIGFVPTMGALHEGHLSLLDQARAQADRVVVSLFVNPAQFAPGEDFAAYPRTLDQDAALLAARGCDLLYAPDARVMYPKGFATTIRLEGPALGLETDFRPDFFAGVATVVTKLFNQVRPDVAVFGEKDFQQCLVVKRLVADLDLGVEIRTGPTLREPDGLAMSSRNAYLSAAERAIASRLNRVLAEAASRAAPGEPAARIEADAVRALQAAGFSSVDYVAVRDAADLSAFEAVVDRPARVLGAAWLGRTRLIDNLPALPGAKF